MTRTVSTIVTYHPKKPAPRRKAQAAAITGSAIVTAADARVRAFFARMVRPPGAF